MVLIPVGCAVFTSLLILGWLGGAPLVIALCASFGLGATAMIALPALGGATPMLFTAFAGLVILRGALLQDGRERIGRVFARHPEAWWAVALLVWVVAGAYLLPRLFAGRGEVFVTLREEVRVALQPLGPSSGNITQTMYFSANIVALLALCALFDSRREALALARRGLIVGAGLNAVLGFLDVGGKLVGAGDILMPIRTGSFALMTNPEQAIAGFTRISGGFPEASSFGIVTLGFFVFTLVDLRVSGSRLSLAITIASGVLLVLSTSSTAYAGVTLIGAALLLVFVRSVWVGRLSYLDLGVILLTLIVAAAFLGAYLYDPRDLEPLFRMIEVTTVKKGESGSAAERWEWTVSGLNALVSTGFVGIGFGSGRASSWLAAFVSQTGVLGTVMLAMVIRPFFTRVPPGDLAVVGLAKSARAAGIAWLVGPTISGFSGDPGLPAFVCLAVLLACRVQLRAASYAPPAALSGPPPILQT